MLFFRSSSFSISILLNFYYAYEANFPFPNNLLDKRYVVIWDQAAFEWLLSHVSNFLASRSLVHKSKLSSMSPISTTKGKVIDPVCGDLKLSIPKMKMIPEI